MSTAGSSLLSRLSGKVAVVTGGANGIGRGCVERFLVEGALVAVIDREEEALRDLAASAAALGASLLIEPADCTDKRAAEAFVVRVGRELGPPDILINNVGQSARERKTTFLASDEEVWRYVIEINLFTTMRFSRLVAPGMVDRAHGRIINMASESALVGPIGSHDYGAAKAGVIGFTRAVARELAPRGVTVNALCPGPIATRALQRSAGDEAKKAMADIPVGFVGDVGDVAAMATLLASEEGRFITGQSIMINGGRWWL